MVMAVSSTSAPGAPRSFLDVGVDIGHKVEALADTSGHAIGAAAVGARALPLPFIAPALAYFGSKLVSKDHARSQSIAGHAGMAAEGVVGAMFGHAAHGAAAHGATAAAGAGAGTAATAGAATHGATTAAGAAAKGGGLKAGLRTAAHTMGKVVPGIVTVVGGFQVAQAIKTHGTTDAVLGTQDGRNGAMNTVGGALLLVPHPVTKLAGAGVMVAALGNDLGWMKRHDDVRFKTTAAAH